MLYFALRWKTITSVNIFRVIARDKKKQNNVTRAKTLYNLGFPELFRFQYKKSSLIFEVEVHCVSNGSAYPNRID